LSYQSTSNNISQSIKTTWWHTKTKITH